MCFCTELWWLGSYMSGFEKRVHFALFIKCHSGQKHASYTNTHRAYFHTLSEHISGTGAAIEAQQSAYHLCFNTVH